MISGSMFMPSKTIVYLLFFPVFLLSNFINGQQVDNIRLSQTGDKIIITYDFISSNKNDAYQLKAYQSTDGFGKAINLVRGDVGDIVKPGKDKQIIWYAREELGAIKGSVIVELRIFESLENLYIQNPLAGSKVKRGKLSYIRWSGGINEDKVSIQLLNDGQLLKTLANTIENTGQYEWNIAKDIKPGKHYTVRILGTGSSGIKSTTSEFIIARKIPLWLYAVPVVAIGGVLPLLDNSSSGDENLPSAPDPN